MKTTEGTNVLDVVLKGTIGVQTETESGVGLLVIVKFGDNDERGKTAAPLVTSAEGRELADAMQDVRDVFAAAALTGRVVGQSERGLELYPAPQSSVATPKGGEH